MSLVNSETQKQSLRGQGLAGHYAEEKDSCLCVPKLCPFLAMLPFPRGGCLLQELLFAVAQVGISWRLSVHLVFILTETQLRFQLRIYNLQWVQKWDHEYICVFI